MNGDTLVLLQDFLKYDYNYEILPFEIYNYKLVVVLSLTQHISKTTVEPKRRWKRVEYGHFCSGVIGGCLSYKTQKCQSTS